MDPAIWVPLTCTSIGVLGSLLALLTRHHLDSVKEDRAAYQQLQTRVMDRAIPALEHNAEVTKEMLEVTKDLQERLMLLSDRDDRRRRQQ